MMDNLPAQSFRLVDFDSVALPLWRIVSIEFSDGERTKVYYQWKGEIISTVVNLPYERAIMRYRTAQP